MKILFSLLVILSCGLQSSLAASTNEAQRAQGVSARPPVADKGSPAQKSTKSAMPVNIIYQHARQGLDTNALDGTGNPKLAAPGHPESGKAVPAEGVTTLAPTQITATARLRQKRDYFSPQDKYGGIAYKLFKVDHPLQLISPMAPAEYGQSEGDPQHDPITGNPSGFVVFSIRFK